MATQAASNRAGSTALRAAPCCVGMPRTFMTSFTPNLRPASGPFMGVAGGIAPVSAGRYAQARISISRRAISLRDASAIMVSCRFIGLLHGDVLATDQFAPQRRFRLDELAEFLGTAAGHFCTLRF